MQELEKKSTYGGKREGAGRKPLPNARNIRVGFTLSPKAYEALINLTKDKSTSKNDAINQLLESL